MDAAAFWQENKRWVIGALLGVMVYFLAKSIVGSLWNPAGPRGEARGVATQARGQEFYDATARTAAQQESEVLRAELQRLEAELAFEPDARYQLGGKGMTADDYLTQQGRALKQQLVQRANRLDVQLLDKDLTWPSSGVADEIRGVLFGLNLIEVAADRLFAAHDQVRKQNPEAMGLRAINSFRMEDRRSARSTLPRPMRPGEVDLRERLTQERISFQFQADAATAFAFLEACRAPKRTLVVEGWTMTQATRPGDPVTVKGTLLGVTFRKVEEAN